MQAFRAESVRWVRPQRTSANPSVSDVDLGCGIVEKLTQFDDNSRGPRHDLLAIGSTPAGPIVIGVEGKADETFGAKLDRHVADALRGSPSSGTPSRVDRLTAAFFGATRSTDPSLGTLRYQLLSGLAGTLADARERDAPEAILLVHEFRTPRTADRLQADNAAALDAFLARLHPSAVRSGSRAAWITDPVRMRGDRRWMPAELPVESQRLHHRLEAVLMTQVVAVDWSGRDKGASEAIWLARVSDGQLVELENGRDRREVTDAMIALPRRDRRTVVGLDFAFGFPAWYAQREGWTSGRAIWDAMRDRAEPLLKACEPPPVDQSFQASTIASSSNCSRKLSRTGCRRTRVAAVSTTSRITSSRAACGDSGTAHRSKPRSSFCWVSPMYCRRFVVSSSSFEAARAASSLRSRSRWLIVES